MFSEKPYTNTFDDGLTWISYNVFNPIQMISCHKSVVLFLLLCHFANFENSAFFRVGILQLNKLQF